MMHLHGNEHLESYLAVCRLVCITKRSVDHQASVLAAHCLPMPAFAKQPSSFNGEHAWDLLS